MQARIALAFLIPLVGVPLAPPAHLEGQLLRRLRNAAQTAAEQETAAAVDRLVRDAVRCVVGDTRCPEEARSQGREVIFTDAGGSIITDEDGIPITDPAAAAAAAGRGHRGQEAGPGEGVWANYDFVPGDRVLFYEDFTDDRVGDFPRRMDFVGGNWEVVEWEGRRLLRNTGPRAAAVKIILPEALPDHFTIEIDAFFTHPNHQMILAPSIPPSSNSWTTLAGHFFRLGGAHGTGVETRAPQGPRSISRTDELHEGLVPVRILVDGRHARAYVNERRVANLPNGEFRLSDELWLENVHDGSPEHPLYIGSIRIAAGGTDLYRKLTDEGRVITQGILFGLNSYGLRPESTPTLLEIGRMLQEHPELRLRIEGHTDSTGDEAANLELSRRRAQAVRDFLLSSHGIEPGRLEAEGFGPARPVDDNTTPEGRQNNRRVELVRLDGPN